MDIVVLDQQIINYLTMGTGIRQRWTRRVLQSRLNRSLLPLVPSPCYLGTLRHLRQRTRISDLDLLRDLRQGIQIVFLTPPIFASIERLHAKYSKLDLYNVVSAAVALDRNVPLAVWNEGQYAEMRRHEGLAAVDWSK